MAEGRADDIVRRLIGVGVGPGDPELVTLKAASSLRAADLVLVPATEHSQGGAGRAEQIVAHVAPQARIRRIPFSMAERSGVGERRTQAWQASADAAIEAFGAGAATVCFATVGDPSVYSTFSYLADGVRARMSEIEVEVIPGITAMQALAAASRIPLVEGTEVLALVPVTRDLDGLDRALAYADTVVAYKGGRQLGEVLAHVQARRQGGRGVLGIDIGLDRQRLIPLDELPEDAQAAYFSTVLLAPERTTTGGRL